jgi:hypothetical protein
MMQMILMTIKERERERVRERREINAMDRICIMSLHLPTSVNEGSSNE